MKGQIQFTPKTQDDIAMLAMSRFADTSTIEKAKVMAYHEIKPLLNKSKSAKKDREIRMTIRKQLKKNIDINPNNVKIVVKDGWVTLYGEQNWDYQKASAMNCIHLRGIKGIINNIVVKTDRNVLMSFLYENLSKP